MTQLAARRHKHTDTSTPHKEGVKSSRLPVSPLAMRTPIMQTKLEVNTPGDVFEQEADAVANSVMPAPMPLPQPDDNRASVTGVQRMTSLAEEPIQRQSTHDETIQRQGDGKPDVSPSTAATIHNPGAGNPIPSDVRHRLETRLGANFSDVRVHTGSSANKAANSLQARAFTYGDQIFLNNAESSGNLRLMAHELTHVVQQGAAPIQRQAIAPENPVQRQTVPEATIQRLSLSSILDTAENVIDLPDALVQLVHDIENAGGIFAYLENLIEGVVDSIFGGLQRGADTVSNLIQNFNQLFTSTAALGTAIINGDRQGFTNAVINLTTALQAIFGDAWDALDTLLGPVRDFLDGVLATLEEPITAWIERLAGGIWNTIINIGQHIWDWTADIRDSSLVNWAWNDIREELGITGPDTFDGLLAWVKGLANDAWESIKGQFSGVITAIRETVSTIREVISVENIRALREMVDGWIVNARDFVLALNADDGNGVASQQDLLRDVLIPAIKAGAATLREAIVGAGNWIAGLIANLATKVTGFIDNLRSVPILSAIPELFDWVSTAVNDLSTWAQSTVTGLFTSVGDGIVYLTQFIEPFLTTLTNLVTATSDLLNNLPNLISAAWNAIPAWIRDPIKDFVLNKVLARIPLFSELVRNPEVWTQVQETAMRILQQIFVAGDLRGAAWTFFQALLELLHFPTQLVVQIINKAVAVFNNIIENPGGFFMNLLQAVKQGFSSFFDNILTHLLNGVQGWLLGQAAEAGIQPPQDFSLGSIFQFVLDVLGINMDLIWERLSVKIGAERVAQIRQAINVLTGAWEWISLAINEGPGALWEKLQERLGELWNQVLDGVIDWISQTIIDQAKVRLLSLLDPTGIMAVVNSVIALYNAIESFIQYFTQMLEIVNKVLDGIQEIASGAVAGAAQFLETALADALPIAIGFLANQVGLGGLGARLREMIEMVRGYVIQGIDWLIDQAIRLGGAVLRSLGLSREEGNSDGSQTPPEIQSRHEAILRELIPRLEEDSLSPTLSDAEWLAGKRHQAEQLERDIQPRLEQGVHLHIAIEQGSIPRQLIYNMEIAPNTVGVSGSTAPPILTQGELYTFFVDKQGNPNTVTGKFLQTAVINGQQVIWYDPGESRKTEYRMGRNGRPLGHSPVRTYVPAFQPNGTPNYRLASAGGGETPVFRSIATRNTSNGIQAIEVDAEPLALTAYSAPREIPPGLSRIKMNLRVSGDWVPGHLVNGSMGGPGTNNNMVPIPRGINAQMRGNYENTLRSNLQAGKYYYFHAKVAYHPPMASTTIGHTTDFTNTISINYQEVQKTGSTWTRIGSIISYSYTVNLPHISELDPNRVNG